MTIYVPHFPKIAGLAKRLGVNALVRSACGNGENVVEDKVFGRLAPCARGFFPLPSLEAGKVLAMTALLCGLPPVVVGSSWELFNHGVSIFGPSFPHNLGMFGSTFGAHGLLLHALESVTAKSEYFFAHLGLGFLAMLTVPKRVSFPRHVFGMAILSSAGSTLAKLIVGRFPVISGSAKHAIDVSSGSLSNHIDLLNNRVNSGKHSIVTLENGGVNPEPSRACKAKALGVRKVQRLGGEETITRPRAPDTDVNGDDIVWTIRRLIEAVHKQFRDNIIDDFLKNTPIELLNDARWTPKQVVVPISFSGEELRANEGSTRVHDIYRVAIDSAEESMINSLDLAMHGDGTGDGGKALLGLGGALPIVTDTGVYAGIDRAAHPIWRTTTFDAATDFPDVVPSGQVPAVDATTIRPIYARAISRRSANGRAADLLIASEEHFWAYDASLVAHQRLGREEPGVLGFNSLEFRGAGNRARVVMASGIRNNMPANTTYGIESRSLFIYQQANNAFTTLFDGRGQMPINQDALAQFLLWVGELVLVNPLYSFRLIDSSVEE